MPRPTSGPQHRCELAAERQQTRMLLKKGTKGGCGASGAGAAGGRVVSGAAAFGSEQTRVTSRWSEQLEKIACVSDLPLAPCMPAWRACGISCPFI